MKTLEILAQLLLADEILERAAAGARLSAHPRAPSRAPPCAALGHCAELLQAGADQLRRPAASPPSRRAAVATAPIGLGPAIAEIDQGRDRIGHPAAASLRRQRGQRRPDGDAAGLVLQLGDDAAGELRPDAAARATGSPCPRRRWRGRDRRAPARPGSRAPAWRPRPAPWSAGGTSRAPARSAKP